MTRALILAALLSVGCNVYNPDMWSEGECPAIGEWFPDWSEADCGWTNAEFQRLVCDYPLVVSGDDDDCQRGWVLRCANNVIVSQWVAPAEGYAWAKIERNRGTEDACTTYVEGPLR